MQFKIKKVSVKISFSFLALILLLFVSGNSELYLITLLCASLHELIHILFIFLFSGEISAINFSVIGADIKRRSSLILSNIKEAVISISAPLFNMILFAAFYNFSGSYKCFSDVNFTLGLVNLLPFYSFDGGCFFKYMILSRYDEMKADKILTVTSIITVVIFCIFSILISIIDKKIHSSFLLCLFMVLSLVFKK